MESQEIYQFLYTCNKYHIYRDTIDTKGRKGLSIIIYKQKENNADI